jgi:hypothetical protein
LENESLAGFKISNVIYFNSKRDEMYNFYIDDYNYLCDSYSGKGGVVERIEKMGVFPRAIA